MRYTVLYRLWVILSGGIAIIAMPFWFDSVTQGYFYAFNSLVAAQILFELGIGFVITQLVAHEMAHLKEAGGDEPRKMLAFDRIAEVYRFSERWFLIASMIYGLLVGVVGFVFFSNKSVLPLATWGGAWCLLIVASALNLRLSPYLAMLEGAGQLDDVARLRLQQSVVGHLSMWSMLFAGMGLWALPLVPAICAVFTRFWIGRQDLIVRVRERLEQKFPLSLDWRREVLPLQWKIALSWASGYFLFQAMTPIAFARLGPVAAGQLGLALAVFNGVQSVGLSVMYAKTPKMAEFIALGERWPLNRLFRRAVLLSSLAVGLGVLAIQGGQAFLVEVGSPLAERLPQFLPLLCLGAACMANSLISSMALYMRSHKEEPMLVSSVVGGILTLFGVYGGAEYGMLPMVLAYTGVTVLIGLPWAWILFQKYYARN